MLHLQQYLGQARETCRRFEMSDIRFDRTDEAWPIGALTAFQAAESEYSFRANTVPCSANLAALVATSAIPTDCLSLLLRRGRIERACHCRGIPTIRSGDLCRR